MKFCIQFVLLSVGIAAVSSHPQLPQLIPSLTSVDSQLTPVVVTAVDIATHTCETNPTHLTCGLIGVGHSLLSSNYPPTLALRSCNFLKLTPHCCRQLCSPATAATCDQATGACFCEAGGPLNICNAMTDSTPGLSDTDKAVLNDCRSKCFNNPTGCRSPATVTDGPSGFVCTCFCPTAN